MAESVDLELQSGPTPVGEVLAPPPGPAPAPAPAAGPSGVPAPLRRWQRQAGENAKLMRPDRPIGIWLLLWPTLWALVTDSPGHPRPRLVGHFGARSVLMASAAG